MLTIIFGFVVGFVFFILGIVALLIVARRTRIADYLSENKERDKITAELLTTKRKWPRTSD